MRIFWKHIFRGIKRSPLQSLLIVITLIISTAAFVVSAKSFFVIRERFERSSGTDNYISDITVSLSSASELRILFEDDLCDVVGSSGEVLGEFALSGLHVSGEEKRIVKFYAVDFEKADAFYKFKFTDYGEFTAENYKKSIIISTDLAEEYGLSVGDKFSLLLLNRTYDFTVEAVAVTEGPFYECGALFSIDAVRDELALSNPVINSFYEGFTPYSQLRVRVKNSSEIDAIAERISADERFDDKIVLKNTESDNIDFLTKIAFFVTAIAVALVLLLSSIVVSGSLDLIRDKRTKDTALFVLCGAERKHLNKIVYFEGILYSVLGLLGSIPVSRVLYVYVNNKLHFGDDGIKNDSSDWILAAIASVIVTLASTFIHLRRERKKTSYELICGSETKNERRYTLTVLAIASGMLLVPLIAVWILPAKTQLAPSVAAMFAFLLWFFVAAPIAFKWCAWLAAYICVRFKKAPSLAVMTAKNVFASHPLRHTGRLISVLLIIICTIFYSTLSVNDQTDMIETIFDCDYVAIGADEGCDELVERDGGVADSFRVSLFEKVKTEQGTGVVCVSADDGALPYINDGVKIDKMPSGDEIYVSVGVAKLYGASEGDKINLGVGGRRCTFTVAQILKIKSNFVFVNAEHLGCKNDKLAIVSNGKYSNEEQLSSLSSVLNPRGAMVIDFFDVTGKMTGFAKTLVAYLEFIVLVAICTTAIGTVNLIISQHNARAQEFSVLYVAGFTKKKILLLELCEIFAIITFAAILAIPGSYAFSAVFDFVLNAFGADFLH